MRTLIELENGEQEQANVLLCELGEQYVIHGMYDERSRTITSLQYLEIENWTREIIEKLSRKFSELKSEKQFFCSAFPKNILIPRNYFFEQNILHLMFDMQKDFFMQDQIPEWQIINSYAFPDAAHKYLSEQFPSAEFRNVFTPSLKIYNGFTAENQVAIFFNSKQFRVIIKKGGQLQLAQMYIYTSSSDVIYYLLKIFLELDLSKDDTILILSGLIEEDSALYKQLFSYFPHIHFAVPSTIKLLNSDKPHHYFTSLYNLAACVS
ncbi:MAG: DUF3822 family protein [Flavisolibacter sp.]|nr:DUF3822 family protein [Flavisolibacter sp.]